MGVSVNSGSYFGVLRGSYSFGSILGALMSWKLPKHGPHTPGFGTEVVVEGTLEVQVLLVAQSMCYLRRLDRKMGIVYVLEAAGLQYYYHLFRLFDNASVVMLI